MHKSTYRAVVAVMVTVVVLIGTTACGNVEDLEPRESNMDKCIAAGGDYVDGAWGDACYMNGAPDVRD